MLIRLALATATALLLQAGTALAGQTFTVTRFDDALPGDGTACGSPSLNCSLRHAIQAAQGGSNTIALGPGTYDLTQGQLSITGTILIAGAGARSTTIEQLTPSSRVISVTHPGGPAVSLGLSGVTVTGGSTDDSTSPGPSGAGIYAGDAGVTLADDAIVGNRAYSNQGIGLALGGGISHSAGLNMKRTTVAYNHATATGVAVAGIDDLGSLYADDSTVSHNVATIFGPPSGSAAVGGIAVGVGSSASASTASVTLSDNSASGAAGANAINAGNFSLGDSFAQLRSVDTIFARGGGDPGKENCGNVPGATVTSRGYNLQDRPQQCGLGGTGDLTSANPLLAALGNNGGQTDTLALGPGSAAIDHGVPGACPDSGSSTLATDQRGQPRVQGGRCDIGAFESVGVPAPKLSKLKLKPSSIKKGKGTKITYTDTQTATTTLTVMRRTKGAKSGNKCVPSKKKPPAGKKCTFFKTVGSFTHADSAGANSLHWSGKLNGKAIGRGRYRLQAVARSGPRKSAAVTAGFTITG